MINFSRLSKYLLAYVLLLIIAAVFTVEKIIRPIDLAVYKEYYLKSELTKKYKDEFLDEGIDKITNEIKDRIIFIDIITENWDKGDYLKNLRSHETELLKIINSKVTSDMSEADKPIVVFDVTFKSESVGLDDFSDAMWPLIEKDIKIYASYKLPNKEDEKYKNHDEKQAFNLYNDFFTSGRLNTEFYSHEKVDGLVSYYSFEVLNDTVIKSLPVQIAKDINPNLDEIDLNSQKIYPLPLKLPINRTNLEDNYFVFTNDTSSNASNNFSIQKDSINLLKKIIIIGTPEDKQQIGEYDVPGPYIVATALIDQLNGNDFTKKSHENIVVQIGSLFFFAFFVCLFFAVIYKYIKKLQTRPVIIAFLSWILGVILLIIIGYALLEFVIIRPAFPLLSMLFAAVLAWHFTKKFLVTGIMQGGEVYDVFISYSFGDSNWVKKNLFNPLNEFKKSDGNKLKIFFAEKSIGISELFTTKYMRAIVDSKLFIPVMSEEYYKKNHCRNEMDLGFKRHVEKLMNMCIVALDYKYVPEEFTNINFVDIAKQNDLMAILEKQIDKGEQKKQDKKEKVEISDLDIEESKPLEKKEKVKTEEKIKKGQKKKEKKKTEKKVKKDKKVKAKKRPEKKIKKEEKKKKKEKKNKSKALEKEIVRQLAKKIEKHLSKKNKKKKKK